MAADPEEMAVDFTILLPCLDEAECLERCIRKAFGSIEQLGLAAEVLIADNGSTDGSQEIARRSGARVIDVPQRGYGAALQAGIVAANGRYVIMADADDSYALDDLEPFVLELLAGTELVMGNRFRGGVAPGAMPFLHRYLGNPVLSVFGRVLFGAPVGDFHCGLRGVSRSAILELSLSSPGMEYASEMVVKASLGGCSIAEVPTTLQPDGRSRAPHLRTWHDGWRHLRFMLSCSPRWLFVYPGAAFVACGLIGVAVLAFGPVTIGRVTLSTVSMVFFAFLAIIGFQVICFGIAARNQAAILGVLPENSGSRLLERFTLERGLLMAVAVFLVGLVPLAIVVGGWVAGGLGQLDPITTLHRAIPGLVLVAIGVQGAFASFFLGVSAGERRA